MTSVSWGALSHGVQIKVQYQRMSEWKNKWMMKMIPVMLRGKTKTKDANKLEYRLSSSVFQVQVRVVSDSALKLA